MVALRLLGGEAPSRKDGIEMPWHCTRCGKVYLGGNHTRREVLNAWWKHMKKEHPRIYAEKKEKASRKAVRTRQGK